MSEITSIRVDYKHVDGWHVFSSEKIVGLYVASVDAERAYNDVPKALEKLLRLNTGIACEVKQELSFSEFIKHFGSKAKAQPKVTSKPHVFESQRYAVYACA